jgi:hypothetical protein
MLFLSPPKLEEYIFRFEVFKTFLLNLYEFFIKKMVAFEILFIYYY